MRLFAGIFPPEEALEQIVEVQRELRLRIRVKGSWTAPEKMHITLRFFGEEQSEEAAAEATEAALEGETALEVVLDALGGFPNARRARVGFIEPTDRQELARLASKLLDRLDPQPHAHLTMVRFREPAALPATTFAPIGFKAAEVVLVRSVPGGPAKGYHVLKRWELLR